MMITPALLRPAECSRCARASVRFSYSRSALIGFGGGPVGGGTRSPPLRSQACCPLNGMMLVP